ncbi:hypothetical protein AAMO2058_000359300 [Amorphochlora amoebiformis]
MYDGLLQHRHSHSTTVATLSTHTRLAQTVREIMSPSNRALPSSPNLRRWRRKVTEADQYKRVAQEKIENLIRSEI